MNKNNEQRLPVTGKNKVAGSKFKLSNFNFSPFKTHVEGFSPLSAGRNIEEYVSLVIFAIIAILLGYGAGHLFNMSGVMTKTIFIAIIVIFAFLVTFLILTTEDQLKSEFDNSTFGQKSGMVIKTTIAIFVIFMTFIAGFAVMKTGVDAMVLDVSKKKISGGAFPSFF